MPLDPRLLLSSEPLNILGNVQQGLLTAEQLNFLKALPELLRQEVAQNQQQLDSFDPEYERRIRTLQEKSMQQNLQAGEMGLRDAEQKTAASEQDRRLQSLGQAALGLESYASKGDMEGAKSFTNSLLSGGNLDPQDAQDILDLIEQGPEALISRINAVKSTLFPQKGGEKRVQSSQFLEGGGVRLTYSDGSVEVKRPDQATADFVKQSEERGAMLQGLRAGERKEAESASKVAKDAYDSLTKIQVNVGNLNEGIKLLDEGANTGVVNKYLPSVKASSIKLDNLQKRLGLDVIGNTTFGALSEGELNLALDTALPKGLSPPDLRQWMVDHRNAQVKLANYLNEAVQFLGTPGNKIKDFMQLKQNQQRLSTTTAPQNAQTVGRFKVWAQ